jgi:tripartite-type tricarboxylate transporter receptor subunit TctC
MAGAIVASVSACARAGTDGVPMFAGATIRIVVGFSPGGVYDLHARLIALRFGAHLPGQPTVVVENMPGAGSGVAGHHVADVALPDGTTIGMLAGASPVDAADSLLGQLAPLGSPAPNTILLLFSKRSGIATLDDWRRSPRPVRFGASGPRALTYTVPLITQAALGLPLQVVSGYAGSSEIRLALEGGEVDAIALTADSAYNTFGANPPVSTVVRFSAGETDDFPAPEARAVAPEGRARDLLESGVYAMTGLTRYLATSRRVPADRIAVLRRALAATFADPEYLAAARAAHLTVAPAAGEALEERLRSISARGDTLTALRAALAPR